MRGRAWLGVALAALAVGLLATAASAWMARPEPAAMPESLAMPVPRPGDRAHYEVRAVQLDTRWAPPPFVVSGLDAAWRPVGTATDAEGIRHTVAELALRADYRFRDPAYESSVHQQVRYDTTTWLPVDATNHEEFPESLPAYRLQAAGIQVTPFDGAHDSRAWFQTRMAQVWRGPCGFVGELVGGGSLGGSLSLGGRCGRLLPNEGPDDLFRAAALEEVAGIPTVRFDNVAHPSVQVWLNPGIPFPVKVRDPLVDLFDARKTNGWTFELVLTGYAPGDGSYPAAPPEGRPSRLPLAPSVRGIPDESGTSHPFPIGAAVARLAQEPDAASFLAAGAYVAETLSRERVDEAGRSTWEHHVVLSDGRAHLSRRVVWSEPPDPRLPLAREATVHHWESGLPGDVTGIYPLPDRVARELPAAAPLVARFLQEANATVRGHTVGWGVIHACWGDCDDPFESVGAYVARIPAEPIAPAVPGAIGPIGVLASVLSVMEDGTFLSRLDRTEQLVAQPLLPLGEAPAAAQAAPHPLPPQGIPYGPLAAAAGGLALAGLAAWLAWGAKAGLGLFSRIEHGRLLDHPGRAAIVQAIEAEPGIHLRELARRTGHQSGALRHHLRKLQDGGLVVVRPLGGYLCCFLPEAARDGSALASASARSEGARKVLEAMQRGATGVREIAAATGLAPSTVSHHLARMRQGAAAATEDGA
jgi:DNA-binding transcriptional ArsR family regulator